MCLVDAAGWCFAYKKCLRGIVPQEVHEFTLRKMASADSSASAPKLFTRAEVAEHTDSTWLIIDNVVYDVTKFLYEHPGGEEVLLEQTGRDVTEAFEDIGHSTDARKMMESYKIGEVVPEERTELYKKPTDPFGAKARDDDSSGSWRSWLIPFALGVLATIVYHYFISTH